MSDKFGKTWWGEAWLNSLKDIDYSNRIPRGASYARTGKVYKLARKGNIFTASVSGSGRNRYKEMIVLPRFTEEQKKTLIDMILQRPALISQLLNRQLMPEMLEIAEECGMKIFPERWNDLKMNCNCPDWAVPCKHLAATIYMISREIDNDPFIVFEMHDMDLLKELENRGLKIQEAADSREVPKGESLLRKLNATDLKKIKSLPVTGHHVKPDYSSLPDLTDSLLRILPPEPAFYSAGDFKSIYENEIRGIEKKISRLFAKRLAIEGVFPDGDSGKDNLLTVDSNLSAYFDTAMQFQFEDNGVALPIASTIVSLWNINPAFLPDYSPAITGLRECLLASFHLALRGLASPKILKISSKEYAVRWFGVESVPEVRKIIRKLDDLIPPGTLKLRKGKSQSAITNQAEILLSFFLTRIIELLSHSNMSDPVYRLFFDASLEKFDGIGENGIPGAIKSWLDYSRISEGSWIPMLTVADITTDFDTESRFELSITLRNRDLPTAPPVNMTDFMRDPRFDVIRFDVLRNVTQLCGMIPGISEYLDNGGSRPMLYNQKTLPELLLKVIPAVRLLGIPVYMPKELEHLLKPKATLKINKRDNGKPMLNLYDLFDYEWRVSLGDTIISPEEFSLLTESAGGLIRFKKSYFYITPDELEKLRSHLNAKTELSPIEIFKSAMTENYADAKVEFSEDARRVMEQFRETDNLEEVPKGLNATLRPYQVRGYSWMYRNMSMGFGSILADDMGLGKTLQTIALILKLKQSAEKRPSTLLVVPVGLIPNWTSELSRFAPDLKVSVYHGPARELPSLSNTDVVITSYGTARSDISKLNKIKWTLAVIDEAQNIKNHQTGQTKALHSLKADCHIALSGTPVENRLSEYWSIMQFVNKGYLGTLKDFTGKYVQPIQDDHNLETAERFRKVTAPFMMRRIKTDKSIISDLPDKIEQNVYASLTKDQAALYHRTLTEAMQIIEGLPTDDSKDLFKRQGIILQMILALKQICNHPSQFLKNQRADADMSGKSMLLLDRLQEIIDANEKVLIFTQFKEMGKILSQQISERFGRTPLFYHGGCSVEERKKMVERFQTRASDKIFILSLKAAGTGLNLTAANHVIHYDLWWNPAVEAQATDRAYRIGQNKNVMVDRFITKGTFEEKINDMINSKRHLAEMTVTSGENWLGKLSNSELREIFS